METTLDIPEVQILVHYPGDRDGLDWHHRILLHRIQAGIWLTLTPDHELQRHDLNAIGHRVLGRKVAFPDDIADQVYAHDPISKSVLAGFKRSAKVQASILGEGEIDDTEAYSWLVAQTGHPKFGCEVDEGLLHSDATGLAFNERGVVLMEGEEVFVERVNDRDLETWKAKKGLETGDMRLLGNFKDSSGKKKLDLLSAVGLMKGGAASAVDEDFPIHGVRAAKEFHDAVGGGSGGFIPYHEQWLRLSGVGKRSSAAHIHRGVCECLRLLHTYDQIDASTTAVGEHLSRWAIQTELAVERNPAQPDYAGLDIVSGATLQADGRATTSKFQEWVSTRLKERSAVWKQERLYNQERRLQRGKGKGGGKDEDDSDEETGGKKRKKKKKGKGSAGGSEPPAGT
eukprot:Skav230205  [mRNA]  locus=scaffold2443:264867:266063:+ [translate_table: standard]